MCCQKFQAVAVKPYLQGGLGKFEKEQTEISIFYFLPPA